MAITKAIQTANGMVLVWVVDEVLLSRRSGGLTATFNGYANEAAALSNENLLWQEYLQLPLSAITGSLSDCYQMVEEYAVGSEGQFAGGVLYPLAPVGDLPTAQRRRWEVIKSERTKAQNSGFTIPGIGSFDSTAESQTNMIGAGAAAIAAQLLGQPYSVEWTLLDNSKVLLTGDQALLMGMALGEHKDKQHQRARALNKMIFEASSIEEVEAISWDTPVPADEEPPVEEPTPPAEPEETPTNTDNGEA